MSQEILSVFIVPRVIVILHAEFVSHERTYLGSVSNKNENSTHKNLVQEDHRLDDEPQVSISELLVGIGYQILASL